VSAFRQKTHYAALRQLLTEYADELAQEIDGGDPLAK
jgi:hypothetical protein